MTVYLDLLGYQNVIRNCSSQEKLNAELAKLRGAFDRAGTWLSGEGFLPHHAPRWKTRAFTDNIVIGYPTHIPSDLAEGELGSMFFQLSFFQFYMIREGYFVRGAIAVGDLYIDDEIVFGPALLEAYDAESKRARDPRIILAPSAEELVKRHLPWYSDASSAPHNRSLLRDVDGQLFLDYLEETILVAEDEAGPFLNELVEHKQRIEQALAMYTGNPHIWAKYRWSAAYHNYFVDSHEYDDEYRISEKLFAPAPSRLSDLE